MKITLVDIHPCLAVLQCKLVLRHQLNELDRPAEPSKLRVLRSQHVC